MIEAKEIEGELWIKATDHHKEVKNAHERGVQDGMKREHAMWQLAKVGQEIEANHCQRCGKKLGTEVTDIHTCTPMRREWVGLTDKEIAHIEDMTLDKGDAIRLTAVALKEKNSD